MPVSYSNFSLLLHSHPHCTMTWVTSDDQFHVDFGQPHLGHLCLPLVYCLVYYYDSNPWKSQILIHVQFLRWRELIPMGTLLINGWQKQKINAFPLSPHFTRLLRRSCENQEHIRGPLDKQSCICFSSFFILLSPSLTPAPWDHFPN